MDENFNNRAVDGSKVLFSESVVNSNSSSNCSGHAIADADVPLSDVLGALEDGRVAIAGDLVAIRAGPETYHPIKALKVMPEIEKPLVQHSLSTHNSASKVLFSVCKAVQLHGTITWVLRRHDCRLIR